MKIGIIGGGPAGIAAAIAIKQKNSDIEVFILEKQSRLGGKIPLTGNGRCNISNKYISTDKYFFSNDYRHIVEKILHEFDLVKLKSLLKSAGIIAMEEDDRLYPASEKASQVRDALEALVLELGIMPIVNSECCGISKDSTGSFCVSYKDKENKKYRLYADRVILSTGSPASLKRSADNNSLYLAKQCGLDFSQFFPALTGYICDKTYDKSLAGVRAKGCLKYKDIYEEGEIQFTEDGISGIPTFQMSLSIGEKICSVRIPINVDFLYYFSKDSIDGWAEQIDKKKVTPIHLFLSGLVNPKVAISLLNRLRINPETKVCDLEKNKVDSIIWGLKNYKICLERVKDINNAQVAIGGLGLHNFNEGLQAIDCHGLYSCGEILDVAGRCGGFNLHFAFASGWMAGVNAANI